MARVRLVRRGDRGLWSSDCCFGAAGCWLVGASDDGASDDALQRPRDLVPASIDVAGRELRGDVEFHAVNRRPQQPTNAPALHQIHGRDWDDRVLWMAAAAVGCVW